MENRNFKVPCNTGWYNIIKIKWRILVSPSIIIPVDNSFLLFSSWVNKKRGSVISAPCIVCRIDVERNFADVNTFFDQAVRSKLLHLIIVHVYANLFAFRQRFNKQGIFRVYSVDLSRPGSFFMWPAQPGCAMLSKFC